MPSFATAVRMLLLGSIPTSSLAFTVPTFGDGSKSMESKLMSTLAEDAQAVSARTGKPTGTSFLPEEAVERAKNGNKIEKDKIQKDPTSAFVDIYEYARRIREGEMTWEEVEKADLDSVRNIYAD